MSAKQVYEVRKMMRKGCPFAEIHARGHNPRAVHALEYHLTHATAARAARYIRRHLGKWPTAYAVENHFRSKGAA